MNLCLRGRFWLVAASVLVPGHAALAVVHIDIGSARGGPGATVSVTVSLNAAGASVAATANDITFDTRSLSLDPSACQVNPNIKKSLLGSVLPSGAVRIFVQAQTDTTSIPNGPLYTCTLAIAPSALPMKYPLRNGNQGAFAPSGAELARVTGANGSVTVSIVLVPTPTRTVTPTGTAQSPTITPIPPTATATGTPAVVCTPPPCNPREVFFCPADCPGGCGTQCATPTPTISCIGDCSRDGSVTIDEVLLLVNIALDNVGQSGCSAGTDAATIDALLSAVSDALLGCHQSPSMPLRFVGFDASEIAQADVVDESSADVDVVQDQCTASPTPAPEPFTATTINARLANDETADIHLQQYTIDTGPRSGLGVIERNITATIPGNGEAAINGVVLFDLSDKARVSPDIYGEAITAVITFFGSDPHRPVQATVPYTVTFANFDVCPAEGS